MEVNEILKKFDSLNREGKLGEAEAYLNRRLEEVSLAGRKDLAISLLNEQMGFYRDTGRFDKSIEAGQKSLELLEEISEGDTLQRAAAYINIANAYRANGDLEESFGYFEKTKKILELIGDDATYSSYYNNIALLHQEAGRFEDAVECLKKALYIADEKMNDEIRVAISKTNLASSLIRIRRVEEARELLASAVNTFEGRTPSDFHYSAALSALGNITMLSGRLDEAIDYFEKAKSEILLHMGENNFYHMVDDTLKKIYEMKGGKPKITGLELCRRYYEAFGKPVINRSFKNLLEHIAVGMAGEGSECLGFDDDISADHDFGPGFVIWVDNTVSDSDIKKLQDFYSLLPKSYMGYTRLETAKGQGRVGVIKLSDYLKKATGFDHFPEGITEWQYTVDENLVLLINGEIYQDKGNIINSLRQRVKEEQPYYVYFMKLSIQLENMAKYGQYSFERAKQRKDEVTASLAKADFMRATMRAMHIIAGRFAPYSKWLRKSLDNINEFSEAGKLLDELALSDKKENIDRLCTLVQTALNKRGLYRDEERYLAVAAAHIRELANKAMIADEIVNYEWKQFDKTINEGGRASCQDDWYTFSRMRRSQYYSYPMTLLQTIYADFSEAAENGRNIITEKYGYMMESTAPEGFMEIKDKLPSLPDDKKAVIEEIVKLQISMMEEFAKDYPKMAGNARVIHTSEDTAFMTSYETYLRGELSTYHPDTLTEYGRFIVGLAQKGDNLPKRIMNMTAFLYGYDSLEKAETSIKQNKISPEL